VTDGDPQGLVCAFTLRSGSAAAISRPSPKRHGSRCAEAQSMPEGPAERGVEATRARAGAGARQAESIDGAERSGSIGPVMAGRHAERKGAPFQSQSCAIDITNGEDAQPDGVLTFDIPGTENLARSALNSSVAMIACRPIVDLGEPCSPRRTSRSECLAAFRAIEAFEPGGRLQLRLDSGRTIDMSLTSRVHLDYGC
jgi:hypothetical protein